MTLPRKQKILDIHGRDPETLDELAQCIINVINHPTTDYSKISGAPSRNKRKVVGFAWDITYQDVVSNSHNATEGKLTNWDGTPDKPKGYAGFYGRVWIRYEVEPDGWWSDAFTNTLTHTGTGGAGSYYGLWETISRAYWTKFGHKKSTYNKPAVYSWDYKIFLDDWPGVALWLDKCMNWATLRGDKISPINHKFQWEDPSIVEKDNELLEYIKKITIDCIDVV